METKVLITGGAGYIGSALVASMVREGLAPSVADICPSPSLEAWHAQGAIKFVQCDLKSTESLVGQFDDVVALVHLSARMDDTDDVLGQGLPSVQENLLALMNLINCLPRLNYICFLSTIMVYKDPPLYSPIDEEHPTEPTNTYGTTKLATEQFLRVVEMRSSIPVTVLRVCGVYGPGQYSPLLRNRAIPTFIRRVAASERPVVYGDGSERRDYVYIDDVVQAIRLSLQRKASGIFGIGSGRGVSILELAKTIIELLDADLEPIFEGERTVSAGHDYTLDISKATAHLGYVPAVPLRQGLAREIDWFRRHRNTS